VNGDGGSAVLGHLLAVQDLDTAMVQLQHRRDALGETSGLAALEVELAALVSARAEVGARRDTLAATQKELEQQIAALNERRSGIEKRMYAATGSSARDLQAMSDEVRHLAERQAELEELELVAMVDQDPLDAEVAALDERASLLEAQAGQLREQVARDRAEIDGELATAASARAEQVAFVPPALAERYEALRARLKGTGAARLVGSRCDGCHLELPSVEVERIRALPPGEIITCEQCGRILVPS